MKLVKGDVERIVRVSSFNTVEDVLRSVKSMEDLQHENIIPVSPVIGRVHGGMCIHEFVSTYQGFLNVMPPEEEHEYFPECIHQAVRQVKMERNLPKDIEAVLDDPCISKLGVEPKLDHDELIKAIRRVRDANTRQHLWKIFDHLAR
jgi:hypothetical protein